MKEGETMDYSSRLSISYYKTVATINEPHQIFLVQHQETGKFYVKKILDVYSLDVYRYLKDNPIIGIPRIIDFHEENGKLTLIEEFAPGTTLREKIESRTLTQELIGTYMIKLCEILEKLHSHNPPLIHRDIKPSNIMINSYDEVILLDFNAAKYSSNNKTKESDTVLLGTQGYAAPEQYGFGESSPQTDIYSIGIILKEAIESLANITHKFDSIISKCTQMDPTRRFQSAKELKVALMKALGNDLSSEADQVSITSFLPPGFRTMTPGKMIVAIPVYIMIFWLCFTLEVKNTYGAALWLERIFVLLIMLGDIFIGYNYLGILSKFPLCRNDNKVIRTIGAALFIIIYTVAMFFILLLLEVIIFHPGT